ncbi:MAG: hypothetical protein ACTSU2_10680 [Promethearchaeota archaeon]
MHIKGGFDNNKTAFTLYIGYILTSVGELLVILEGLLFFLYLKDFSNELSLYSLLPIPVFVILELIIYICNRVKVFKGQGVIKGFFYFIFIFFANISFYIGGGWYFGAVYIMIGIILRVYGGM